MRRPFVVGICGGIGSGKSAAARIFERLGARVIDADRIAHAVLGEPSVIAAVRARLGDAVMTVGGEIDRQALARRVFGDGAGPTEARRTLESIVHPIILARILSDLREARSSPRPPGVVVIDAPLLLGSPLQAECDEIVFVDAPEDVRLARTAARGWTPEEHRARERAQGDLAARKRAATRVLANRGALGDLESAAATLHAAWVRGS
jgi:dephospho-CoA kinase